MGMGSGGGVSGVDVYFLPIGVLSLRCFGVGVMGVLGGYDSCYLYSDSGYSSFFVLIF